SQYQQSANLISSLCYRQVAPPPPPPHNYPDFCSTNHDHLVQSATTVLIKTLDLPASRLIQGVPLF
ncbi:hypothetical protein L9F63_004734, partial [Diploptera punctata]